MRTSIKLKITALGISNILKENKVIRLEHHHTYVKKLMKRLAQFIIPISITVSSCSVFQKNSKKEFNDGFYTQNIDGVKQKVYIDVADETIRIHPSKPKENGQFSIDTCNVYQFQKNVLKANSEQSASFSKPSFDIDFLTIPLKFRPAQTGVPMQLNTNLNGAGYFGYRRDKYIINYTTNPLGVSDRSINHLGFSFGAFTGLGNSSLSPTTTNNAIQQEYEGVVWSKGFAGIFAVNNFTVGMALGFDHLLDGNRSTWIYQNKLWYGLAFGLNLN
ncbi:MAG: hypothetical protein K0R59_4192 [Sphingobacterium sp.]|jgi:hypothetical protein|nr:hypothetical protein [Sphingobacterium sp.]OOG18644.1 hypothetical protein BWD42_01345 [Sphingobacterium sp. CZ-UAM]